MAKVTPFERRRRGTSAPSNALERRNARLVRRLRSTAEPIVWLRAGAGTGKSTLLNQLREDASHWPANTWVLLDDPPSEVLQTILHERQAFTDRHARRLLVAMRPGSPAAAGLLKLQAYGQVAVLTDADLWIADADLVPGTDDLMMSQTGGWPMLAAAYLQNRSAGIRELLPGFLEREVLPAMSEDWVAAAFAALTTPVSAAAPAHPLLRADGAVWRHTSVWVRDALLALRRSSDILTPSIRAKLNRYYTRLLTPDRAIADMTAIGEHAEALEVFKNAGGVFFGTRNGYHQLETVLEAFGPELEQTVEELYLARLWLLIKSAKPREALLKLEERHPGLPVDLREMRLTHRAEAVLLRIDMSLDIDATPAVDVITSWGRLQSFLPPGDNIALGLLYNSMAIGFLQADLIVEAKRLAEESLAAYAAAGSPYLVHCMLLHLCDIALRQSRLDDASQLLQQAERALAESGQAFNSEPQILLAFKSRIAYEEGRIEASPAEIQPILSALLEGDSWPDLIPRISVPFVLAGYWSRGLRHALERLDECILTMRRRHGSVTHRRLALLRIRLMQVARHHAEADMLLEEYDLETGPRRSEALAVEEGLIRLRQAVVQERSLPTVGRLADLLTGSPQLEVRQRISIAILRAAAFDRQGSAAQSRRHLRLALREAEAQNLMAVLLEDGEFVERLVPAFIAAPGPGNSRLAHFASRLMRLLKTLPAAPLNSKALAGVSRQEHRVLSYVADGYTNKQIGRALVLSESTVKFHLRSLFKKLGVRRRSALIEAVKARGIAT